MTIEQFRELHQKRPFEPFEIHLADGRTLTVAHPELVARSASGRAIAVARPDDRGGAAGRRDRDGRSIIGREQQSEAQRLAATIGHSTRTAGHANAAS